MTKVKTLALSTLAIALMGCQDNTISEESGNAIGSVALSGDALVGSSLTATVTDDNGVDESAISYTWMADDVALTGSTNSYLLTAAEDGKTITVTVSYTDDDGYQETAKSTPSPTVETPAVNVVGLVSISGIAESGQLLSASIVDDNNFDASQVSYSWAADGMEISTEGATYALTDAEIGKVITVTATYVDADGFEEMITSAATDAVAEAPAIIPPEPGTITLNGSLLKGQTLTASVFDANGIDGDISYAWYADDAMIDGATGDEFTLTTSELGKIIKVTASYSDGDGTAENVEAMASERIYSSIVTTHADLVTALANAEEFDLIAIGSGSDFIDSGETDIAKKGVVVTATSTSNIRFMGSTCIRLDSPRTGIDGLTFKDTKAVGSSSICHNSSSSETVIKMDSEFVTLTNNTFDGYVGTNAYNIIEVKGEDNTIARNLFTNFEDNIDKSGVISIFGDKVENAGDKERTTIEYNLFENIGTTVAIDSRKSGKYLISVGRSTGSESIKGGFHLIANNLFNNVYVDQRLIKVQSSQITINGNTVTQSAGMISLEDGSASTVTNNIIMPTADDVTEDDYDKDAAGIAFAPLGHTISNNYVANVTTADSGRGAIIAHSDKHDGSGNEAIIADNTIASLASVVSNNTIYNGRHGLAVGYKECTNIQDFPIAYSNNLVANVSSHVAAAKSEGFTVDRFEGEGCSFTALTYNGNHIFANEVTSGATDISEVSGAVDVAELASADAQGLVAGAGAQATVGADITKLHKISSDQVGPGSTWSVAAD